MSPSVESWLAVQVERLLDREEERHLTEQAKHALAMVSLLVLRAEAIQQLRAAKGRDLSSVTRAQLAQLHDQLQHLRTTLSEGTIR
jgi:hypothetical protein